MSLLKKIALLSVVAAAIFLAFGAWWMHRAELARSRKLSEAADEINARAESGDAAAEYDLARIYYEGRGVREDSAAALDWYRKSAEQGYAKAEFALGDLYFQGKGVPRNIDEAVRWTQKAADQGYAKAQSGLGYMYFNGVGVPQDYAEAMLWYSRAADQGEVEAEHALGYAYFNGIGTARDYNKAFQWLRRAADQGDAESQAALGSMFAHGLGVSKNRLEAYRWFRKAADSGNPTAKHALDLLRSESMTRVRWFEFFVGLIAIPVGFWLSLEFVLPGRRLKNRRQQAITLLGISILSIAGLDLYAFVHYDMQFSPYQHIYHAARYVLSAIASLILVTVVLPGRWPKPGE